MPNHNTFPNSGPEGPNSYRENEPSGKIDMSDFEAQFANDKEVEPQSSKNPAETTVENATSRLESYEGRGAEIRGKIKDKLCSVGRAAGNLIRRNSDRFLGATVVGAEVTAEFASDIKDAASQRLAQRQDRRERRKARKERAKNEQFMAAKADEASLLAGVRPGDAETFNYMPRESKNERAGRRAAKQEAVDAAHTEALELNRQYDQAHAASVYDEAQAANKLRNEHIEALQLNDQYDKTYAEQKLWIDAADKTKNPDAAFATPANFNEVQRAAFDRANREAIDTKHEEALEMQAQMDAERQAKEDAEYDAAYDKAEEFLKQFKGREHNIDDIRRAIRDEFGKELRSGKEYITGAIGDAVEVFEGKKSKQAARAARIAKGRAKIQETRIKMYEKGRDTVRNSEAYQRASGIKQRVGKAITRFATRARMTRDAWRDSKAATAPTGETESSTNE